MSDTIIMENHKMRQLGGGLLILFGLPITLLIGLLGFSGIRSLADIAVLLPGPAILALELGPRFHGILQGRV